jgi:1,2-diacylglycerol 3-alpha-glucosyltransferase
VDKTICLLNDSFPPLIDGVSNTIKNYARVLHEKGEDVMVICPDNPDKDDSVFDYDILRYHSVDARNTTGFTLGMPFSPKIADSLRKKDIGIMHCHCPATTLFLARSLRDTVVNAPLIMTYHTKYDVDIQKILKLKSVTHSAVKVMVDNISACDEVWTVSKGAGDNLKSLGYKGDVYVMENGVDMPLGRVSDDVIAKAVQGYDLPEGVPVFLFVGRQMWYKGVKIILDAMEGLKSAGMNFRMVFIGTGLDAEAIRQYSTDAGLDDRCIFTGAVRDRELLRGWYARADLFLFPSTYDTNGLVVREAAASLLPTIMIKDSCASEGVTDGVNGFLISESSASLALKLYQLCQQPQLMKQVGEAAARDIYMSWDDAVEKARQRYEVVMDNYARGYYPRHAKMTDELLKSSGEVMKVLGYAQHVGKLPQAIKNRFSGKRTQAPEEYWPHHKVDDRVHDEETDGI